MYRHFISNTIIALVLLFSSHAFAETPVRLIVPFAVGGPYDKVSRILQNMLSEEITRPVSVEFKPGASGIIGTKDVISSNPHEVVLLLQGSALVTNTFKEPSPYDLNDLVPVVFIGRIPMVLVTSTKTNIKKFSQWKSYNKDITIGSVGSGSATDMIAKVLNEKVPKKLIYVQYKGQAPILIDLLSNNIESSFLFANIATEQIKAGKLNALAIDSKKRNKDLPNVPTFEELGVTGLGDYSWCAIFSNRTQDTELFGKIQRALVSILNDPIRRSKLQQSNIDIQLNEIIPKQNFLEAERSKINIKHLDVN